MLKVNGCKMVACINWKHVLMMCAKAFQILEFAQKNNLFNKIGLHAPN